MPVLQPQDPAQRGTSRIPFLFLLALISAAIYLAANIIPAYINDQNLQTATDEIIRRGSQQDLRDEDVRAQLHEKIREYGLPDDYKLELWHEGKGLVAKIHYTHKIRLPFYTVPWPVEIRSKDIGF